MENENPKPISKLKCKDCRTVSIEVRKVTKFDENLCVDCFLYRLVDSIKSHVD